MRCLTLDEQAAWLAENHLPFQPYNTRLGKPMFYTQFYTPKKFSGNENFIEAYLKSVAKATDAMITVVDTPLMTPSNFRIFDQIRLASGEKRLWIGTPAHLFTYEELTDLVGLFCLTILFEWWAYLYIPSTSSVLYNWEGEILDFWTAEKSTMSEMIKLIDAFSLKLTPAGSPRKIS